MPGSQFFIDAKAENRIISENWSDYDLSKVLYRHPIFSEKELFKAQRSMYMKFYLRPIIIFNYLKKLSSFTALANMFRGILGFLKIIRFSK